jgi:hypothetical protein
MADGSEQSAATNETLATDAASELTKDCGSGQNALFDMQYP